MKVAVVFILLFATVLCRPARKVSVSSSESSEEVVRRPAAQPLRKQAVPEYRAAPVQNVEAAATANSDESTESSDEDEQQAAADAPVEIKADSTDTTSSPDTTSVSSQDSEDSDDDDDDDAEETEEDESSDSSESGESSTPAPSTATPMVVTEEPLAETTAEPIVPSIVTDTDAGRGDSLGRYPSDYKSIVYVEDKSYHKVPLPYKSYEFIGTGKKMAYDMTEGNEVDKSLKMYKALQVHSDILEEDTSTPEVESQGLDASSGISQDQDLSTRQASLPEEEESASASDASASESSSTPVEEEEDESASTGSDSTSTSQESEDEDSQSSEEATATPGAADSESDESTEKDSDEDGPGPETTTDMPVVITAK
ncbi:osteopontin isoform X3 [Cottoperca gobio]|uniref:Osteopontin isoform X3 n=1 Tax=Cottoperca gobio TaxID=56716 RepID=A0A6J2QUD1_COTGO|nr:osteopontin isoform X3 [Cottoperca gobio]